MHPKHKKRAPKWAHILLTHDRGATAPVVGIKPQKNACQRYACNNRRTTPQHKQKHKKRAPEGAHILLTHDRGATAPVVGIVPHKNNACQRYAYNNRRTTPPHKQKRTKRAPEGLIYRLTHDRGATAPVVGIAPHKKTRAKGTQFLEADCTPNRRYRSSVGG